MQYNEIYTLHDLAERALENARDFLLKEGYEGAMDYISGHFNFSFKGLPDTTVRISFKNLYFTPTAIFDSQSNTLYDPETFDSCKYLVMDNEMTYQMCKIKGVVKDSEDWEAFWNRIDFESPKPTELDIKINDDAKQAIRIANYIDWIK